MFAFCVNAGKNIFGQRQIYYYTVYCIETNNNYMLYWLLKLKNGNRIAEFISFVDS